MVFFLGFEFGNRNYNAYLESGEYLGVIETESGSRHESYNEMGGFTHYIHEIDEEFAVDIGNTVIKNVFGQEALYDTYFELYEEKDANVYVVHRSKQGNGYSLNPSLFVAIDKTTGAILRVWAQEG